MQRNEVSFAWHSLGSPVKVVSVHSAVFSQQTNPEHLYVVQRGLPAQLSVIDVLTGRTLVRHPLPDAEGAENLVLTSHGELFIPTHPHGKLYRFCFTEDRLEEVPTRLTSPAFLWDAAEADDGTIYVGCWPKSRLLAYRRSGELEDLGSIAPPEDYIRAICYSKTTDRLYLGIGAHAALLEFSPHARTSRNVLPPELQGEHFVVRLATFERWLFVRTTPREETCVFDLKHSERIVARLAPLDCSDIVPLPAEPDRLLIGAKGDLLLYDSTEHKTSNITCGLCKITRALALSDQPHEPTSALVVSSAGQLHRVAVAEHDVATMDLELSPQPLVLQNVAAGPDNRIYTNGYVAGGVGVFDPATGEQDFFAGVNQAESITHDGHFIYFGTYPRAVIMRYDPFAPRSATNPRELLCLAPWDQDRPYAMLADRQRRKLFIGCVPAYGCLGGALAVYDLDTEHARVYRDIIPQQSIVALATDGTLLFGATSTSGGLGIEPRTRSAELFVFHPDTETLLSRTVPVENARGITGLVCSSHGILYGWAEGTLFAFNPTNHKLLWQELVFEKTFPADHYWRGVVMRPSLVESDIFYGAAWGTIFRLDAHAETLTIIARIPDAEVLAPGPDGNLYATAGSELIQIRLDGIEKRGKSTS